MEDNRPHTRGLDSEPDFDTNPCGEIVLPVRPQEIGLRSGRDYIIGHMHNNGVPNEAVYGIYSGTLTHYRIRYNESRS